MQLILPWPPTLNTYRAIVNGRLITSKKGRQYCKDVAKLCVGHMPEGAKLYVHVQAFPPDKRRRDLDNLPKALLDSMGKAGVYGDDSDIDRLEIVRMEPVKLGKVIVTIEEIL